MATRRTSSNDACIDEIASNCLAVRLRMLNRAITAIYDEGLRPFGIKTSQVNVLVVAAKHGPLRPAEIGQILHLDASTVSRNVDRMRVRGWLEIIEDDSDRRAQLVQITPAGRALIRELMPAWREAQQRAVSLLGESALKTVFRSAEKVR
jgi:DNA-binding MarR family transcriptional regulator